MATKEHKAKREKGRRRAKGRTPTSAGTLEGAAAPVSLDVNKGELRDFVPTAAQRRYFVAYAQAILTGGDNADRAIAKQINVHHGSISRWRETPEFDAWLDGEFQRLTRGKFLAPAPAGIRHCVARLDSTYEVLRRVLQ